MKDDLPIWACITICGLFLFLCVATIILIVIRFLSFF